MATLDRHLRSMDAMNSLDPMKAARYSELTNSSDESLMAHISIGNHDALAVLFDRYQSIVLRLAMQILRNPHEAEDLLQSVFLELMRNALKFDASKGTARVWILQCVYHRGFDRRRYLNRRGAYDLIENREFIESQPSAESEEKHVSAVDSARLVKEVLAHLNEAQRKTIEMAFFEGLTMQEIADKTGDSFASVRHHYYRGLEKMRTVLGTRSKKDGGRTAGGEAAYVQS